MSDELRAKNAPTQTLTATTFVELVDTLVGDFDVIEVLTLLTTRCVELLDAGAAGILLADSDGRLRVIGASTEGIQLLELFQIQHDEGRVWNASGSANSSSTPTSTTIHRGRGSQPNAPKLASPRYVPCRSASRVTRLVA